MTNAAMGKHFPCPQNGPIVLFKLFDNLPMLWEYADALLLPTPRQKPGYASGRPLGPGMRKSGA